MLSSALPSARLGHAGRPTWIRAPGPDTGAPGSRPAPPSGIRRGREEPRACAQLAPPAPSAQLGRGPRPGGRSREPAVVAPCVRASVRAVGHGQALQGPRAPLPAGACAVLRLGGAGRGGPEAGRRVSEPLPVLPHHRALHASAAGGRARRGAADLHPVSAAGDAGGAGSGGSWRSGSAGVSGGGGRAGGLGARDAEANLRRGTWGDPGGGTRWAFVRPARDAEGRTRALRARPPEPPLFGTRNPRRTGKLLEPPGEAPLASRRPPSSAGRLLPSGSRLLLRSPLPRSGPLGPPPLPERGAAPSVLPPPSRVPRPVLSPPPLSSSSPAFLLLFLLLPPSSSSPGLRPLPSPARWSAVPTPSPRAGEASPEEPQFPRPRRPGSQCPRIRPQRPLLGCPGGPAVLRGFSCAQSEPGGRGSREGPRGSRRSRGSERVSAPGTSFVSNPRDRVRGCAKRLTRCVALGLTPCVPPGPPRATVSTAGIPVPPRRGSRYRGAARVRCRPPAF